MMDTIVIELALSSDGEYTIHPDTLTQLVRLPKVVFLFECIVAIKLLRW